MSIFGYVCVVQQSPTRIKCVQISIYVCGNLIKNNNHYLAMLVIYSSSVFRYQLKLFNYKAIFCMGVGVYLLDLVLIILTKFRCI